MSINAAAWAVIAPAIPRKFASHAACFLYATAAQTALRGRGVRFCAGGAFLQSSGMTGWGVSIDPSSRQYYLTADQQVDEDGEYCGHCWVEIGHSFDATVVDVMDEYRGPTRDAAKPLVYHHIPSLAKSIRAHYAEEMRLVAAAVRRDKALCEQIRAFAGIA